MTSELACENSVDITARSDSLVWLLTAEIQASTATCETSDDEAAGCWDCSTVSPSVPMKVTSAPLPSLETRHFHWALFAPTSIMTKEFACENSVDLTEMFASFVWFLTAVTQASIATWETLDDDAADCCGCGASVLGVSELVFGAVSCVSVFAGSEDFVLFSSSEQAERVSKSINGIVVSSFFMVFPESGQFEGLCENVIAHRSYECSHTMAEKDVGIWRSKAPRHTEE